MSISCLVLIKQALLSIVKVVEYYDIIGIPNGINKSIT